MGRQLAALVTLAGVFAAGVSVAALGAHSDPPLKSQTYTDAVGDNQTYAPDIMSVVVENWTDGTLEFRVALPREPAFPTYRAVGVFVNSDRNAATGENGHDYVLSVAGNSSGAPSRALWKWTGAKWAVLSSATPGGEFTSLVGVVISIGKDQIGVATGFGFDVRSVASDQWPLFTDDAGPFTYELGVPAVTTSTTATTTTAKPKPKPKPKPKAHTPKKPKKKG